MTLYLMSVVIVLFFAGLLAMAGLGAAFLFVPFFYYLGVPLSEATAAGLFLNAVSLSFASVVCWREPVVNVRMALPVLIVAVVLSPLGARVTPLVNKQVLLALVRLMASTPFSTTVTAEPTARPRVSLWTILLAYL